MVGRERFVRSGKYNPDEARFKLHAMADAAALGRSAGSRATPNANEFRLIAESAMQKFHDRRYLQA
jgi:hypothetical protein